jgi:hypothetical protein
MITFQKKHVHTDCLAADRQGQGDTRLIQGAAFNVTNFESRITHLLYTALNTIEHG